MDAAQALATAREHRAELKAQQQREENARLSFSATKFERAAVARRFRNYGDIGTGVTNAASNASSRGVAQSSDIRRRPPRCPPRRKRFAISPGTDPH